MPARERSELLITDAQAIRAMAHRLRLEVIDELFASQASYTATELAERFGGTPSAMSYHLRALEKWGYLKRNPVQQGADQRERRWQAAAQSVRVGEGVSASALLGSTLLELQFAQVLDRIRAAMAQAELEEQQKPAMFVSTTKLSLDEAQRELFAQDYQELVDRYRLLSEGSEQPSSYLYTVFVPDETRPGPAERAETS